jgi:hypothetical protein
MSPLAIREIFIMTVEAALSGVEALFASMKRTEPHNCSCNCSSLKSIKPAYNW